MTSEQLEAARAERLRQNGNGTLTLDDTRTWIEETGLCLFLPRKQFATSVTPSFVEAIAGHPDEAPNQKQIALAEELLVRLELEGVAVRLNLLGVPGEQPDFVVAAWVLPYVYALRGDRDWRRVPQLTGSRQVSPLAVQVYKHLERGEMNVSQLRQALGREVTEAAVVRAITELWQQLRIIPVIEAPGKAARWQLLRQRFQKAIAEGASTSQVTAISVLASIYLQAVIAASMEEVEIFLQPLTARSKVREVLRGLVATRQVHTISLGPSPHFYVAGTLPEFAPASSIYSSATLSPSSYFHHDHEDSHSLHSPARSLTPPSYALRKPIDPPVPPAAPVAAAEPAHNGHSAQNNKAEALRPHFSNGNGNGSSNGSGNGNAAKTNGHAHSGASKNHAASRAPRHGESRPAAKRSPAGTHKAGASRWSGTKSNGMRKATPNGSTSHRPAAKSTNGLRPAKPAWGTSNGRPAAKSGAKATANARTNGMKRKDARPDARGSVRTARKPVRSARPGGATSGKRFGVAAGSSRSVKKRG